VTDTNSIQNDTNSIQNGTYPLRLILEIRSGADHIGY
jgi:hypothetical protein